MIPGTLGALIAEESTIVPNSPLPSFLERMMMQECRRSGYETLQTAMNFLSHRLMHMEGQQSYHNLQDAAPRPSSSILRLAVFCQQLWRQLSYQACHNIRTRILEPFSPELRFLLVWQSMHTSLP